jgi:multidrug resistance protein, MATE family
VAPAGCRLFKMAWPLASQNVLAQGSFYISMAFAGQLGRDALSAAVLGTSILNVTGFAALAGLASAMETLCGQVPCILQLVPGEIYG